MHEEEFGSARLEPSDVSWMPQDLLDNLLFTKFSIARHSLVELFVGCEITTMFDSCAYDMLVSTLGMGVRARTVLQRQSLPKLENIDSSKCGKGLLTNPSS